MSARAGVPYFGYLRHIVRPVLFSGAVTCAAFAWALCRDEDRRASGRCCPPPPPPSHPLLACTAG